MIEKIKTILLILLVASSIFLTWQIWTYQPTYESLLPTEYVAQEGLAEKKELLELVKPTMLIYHYGEDIYRATYPDTFQYTVIQGQMKDWYFYNFKEAGEEDVLLWQESMKEAQGIELIFPTGIPISSLKELFQIQPEINLQPTNRIWIFYDHGSEEVAAFFFTEDNGQLTKAKTGLSQGDLKTYLALGESRPEFEAVSFSEEHERAYPIHYVTKEPIELMEHQYFYQRIPIENLIPYLFVDPSFVRQIQEREGGTFFTDGSKGLQYHQHELSMYFFHPVSESGPSVDTLLTNVVQRSVQFVNQHQGWEDHYLLHALEQQETEQEVRVTFRKYMGNFPIYAKEEEKDVNMIQLGIHNERVRNYFRPLFQVDKLMNQTSRRLPSGKELLEQLIAQDFPVRQIKRVELAYQSRLSDYHLTYTPYWLIQLEDGTRLFMDQLAEELEEENRALE